MSCVWCPAAPLVLDVLILYFLFGYIIVHDLLHIICMIYSEYDDHVWCSGAYHGEVCQRFQGMATCVFVNLSEVCCISCDLLIVYFSTCSHRSRAAATCLRDNTEDYLSYIIGTTLLATTVQSVQIVQSAQSAQTAHSAVPAVGSWQHNVTHLSSVPQNLEPLRCFFFLICQK